MKYFPIFLKVQDKRIIVSGGGETALAKLRLLLKTEAKIEVYASEPADEIIEWAKQGRIALISRPLETDDIGDAISLYAANETQFENDRAQAIGQKAGILVNVVDTPDQCDFITPAMVDRDPVVIAIGTEGAAPVLGRKIKAHLEEKLSPDLGSIVKIARGFRARVAHLSSKKRRNFWGDFYNKVDSVHFSDPKYTQNILEMLLEEKFINQGFVSFVGAGPGDPELLTLKARKKLDEADVILHDRLVSKEILELARREARIIEVGKRGFGASWKQSDINALIIEEALKGQNVVRLKSGDPCIYGRLDEETEAVQVAGIEFDVIPGISAANAAAASLKLSLTKRNRNSEFRFLTGHDLNGFAEHDWHALARRGECAAIYMGAAQATQLRGRLLMHGAAAQTPVTAIENVSRPNQRVFKSDLLRLPDDLKAAEPEGPVVILYGISNETAIGTEFKPLLEAAE